MVGTYLGLWHNFSFGSTGDSSASITVNQVNKTVSMTIDLDGSVLGGADPQAETFTGPFDSHGFTVTGSSAVFGDLTIEVDILGRLVGMGTDVPSPAIDRVYFSGSASPDTIAIDYLVVFAGGSGTAEGVLTMTR